MQVSPCHPRSPIFVMATAIPALIFSASKPGGKAGSEKSTVSGFWPTNNIWVKCVLHSFGFGVVAGTSLSGRDCAETSDAARSRARSDENTSTPLCRHLEREREAGEIDDGPTSLFDISKDAQLLMEVCRIAKEPSKEGDPSLTKYRNGVRFHE